LKYRSFSLPFVATATEITIKLYYNGLIRSIGIW
jgi:hypothetical protein